MCVNNLAYEEYETHVLTIKGKNDEDNCEKRRRTWRHKQCTTNLKDQPRGV